MSFCCVALLCFNNFVQQFLKKPYVWVVMLRITTAFVSLFLICCKPAVTPKSSLSLKDSIIREYFSNIDSNEFYDTTNYEYRILKAYIKNDTPFFTKMAEDIKTDKEVKRSYAPIDSCLQLEKISEMNADEVYRLSHDESFCYYSQRITIRRSGDSISLHYLEFSGTDDGNVVEIQEKNGVKKFGPQCRIENEFEKSLSKKDWEMLKDQISVSDYWGLKEYNDRRGFDGTSWRVEAYTKKPTYITNRNIHTVYRWSPVNSFRDLGLLFVKLAGIKGGCYDFPISQ